MLKYVAIIIVGIVTIFYLNNKNDDKCKNAGGQVVTYTTKLGHACIYPSKQGH